MSKWPTHAHYQFLLPSLKSKEQFVKQSTFLSVICSLCWCNMLYACMLLENFLVPHVVCMHASWKFPEPAYWLHMAKDSLWKIHFRLLYQSTPRPCLEKCSRICINFQFSWQFVLLFCFFFFCVCVGYCACCSEPVIGTKNGCAAVDKVYHVKCFICFKCGESLTHTQWIMSYVWA